MKPKVPTHLFILLIFLGYLIYPVSASAQNALSKSPRGSAEVFVYKLTRENLRDIHINKKEIDESILHTFIASYPVNGNIPELPRGNYVKVQAKENSIEYSDLIIDNLHYINISNEESLMIYLTDTLDNIISDATIRCGDTIIAFDNEMKVYSTLNIDNKSMIEIENDGVFHYLEINRYSSYEDTKEQYNGFIVLNKPKYKPEETVKFKAYILNRDGTPYNGEADIYLMPYRSSSEQTWIERLEPYRPGLFEGQLVLSDELKMRLNLSYSIALKTAGAQKIELTESFRYEEYRLGTVNFSVYTDKLHYFKGDSVKLNFNAADDNNMGVYDGKVEITVTIGDYDLNNITESFISNKEWKKVYDMTGRSSMNMVLPDSAFVNNVSAWYLIYCTFFSANNERVSKRFSLFKDIDEYTIHFDESDGKLTIKEYHNGENLNTKALVKTFSKTNELISADSISLPATLPIHWKTYHYDVTTANTAKRYSARHYHSHLDYDLFREGNIVKLIVNHPSQRPFWYIIRRDNDIIERGFATKLNRSIKDNGERGYAVQVIYLLDNWTYARTKSLPYFKKNITMEIKSDTIVYPGQTANVQVAVKDMNGKPVKNADITAFAYKSSFGFHRPPDVKIYGKSAVAKPFSNNIRYSHSQKAIDNIYALMNWDRWKKQLKLNNIEYYKFLRPESYYSYSELTTDGVTQVSPYVVIDGYVHGVHILWIDGEPHFLRQAQHMEVYSFPVSPGLHSLKMRTYDREIVLDSVYIEDGMKTIISVDGEKSNSHIEAEYPIKISIKVLPQEYIGILNNEEIATLKEYMITIDNHFDTTALFNNKATIALPAAISYGGYFRYLNHLTQPLYYQALYQYPYKSILTGPFPKSAEKGTLYSYNNPVNNFKIEGGHNYRIERDSVRVENWISNPINNRIRSYTQTPVFTQNALTVNRIKDIFNSRFSGIVRNWGEHLNPNPADRQLRYSNYTCKLVLSLDKRENIKDGALPIYNDPLLIYIDYENTKDSIDYIYSGQTRYFYHLPEGSATINLLYDNLSKYSAPLNIRPNGTNYIRTEQFEQISVEENFPEPISIFLNYLISTQGEMESENPNRSAGRYIKENDLNNQITGVILNILGEPIPEIFVRVSGLSSNIKTDKNGEFKFSYLPEYKHIDIYADSEHLSIPIIRGYDYTITIGRNNYYFDKITAYTTLNYISEEEIPFMIMDNLVYSNMMANSPNTIRRNFHDDAFWQPRISTDKKGVATFEVTYPDDITQWNAQFIAIGERNQADTAQLKIKAFKPLNAQLSVPLFAMPGDSINAIGKLINHNNENFSVTRTIITDSILSKNIAISKIHLDTIPLKAKSEDNIKVTYTLTTESGYLDGEERTIPISKLGLLDTHGEFVMITDTLPYTFTINPALGKATIHAESSGIEPILEEIEKTANYPYLCNEQMASKIKALIYRKRIYDTLRYTASKKYGSIVADDYDEIEELITKLNSNKNNDNLWGWWHNGNTELWISIHVIEALIEAEKEGHRIWIDKDGIYERLITPVNYLLFPEGPIVNGSEKYNIERNFVNTLTLLKRLDAKIDYARYYNAIKSYNDGNLYRNISLTERLKLAELIEITENDMSINTIKNHFRYTMMGSLYITDEDSTKLTNKLFINPHTNNVESTLAVYRILKKAGGYEADLQKMRGYLFEVRRAGSWRNTYESSRIIETTCDDIVALLRDGKSPLLLINGMAIDCFPYTEEVEGNQNITVEKRGEEPIYITVYQQAWNDNPQATANGFSINTAFRENGQEVHALQSGKVTDLEVSLTVDAEAHYVMIEVPIPAGCYYHSKMVDYFKGEIHREYFNDKVSIFCDHLIQGEHKFVIKLIPEYTGTYHINPAKAELMYFPTFFGHNKTNCIDIK